MRKFAGVLLAAALMLPVSLMAAPAGAAAATPTCKSVIGQASFSPALPALKSKATSKPTITIKGAKLTGCTGGGVTGGTVGATLKFGIANNCTTLLAGASTKTTGTVTIAWNTKKTSTAKVTLVGAHRQADLADGVGPDHGRPVRGQEGLGRDRVHPAQGWLHHGRVGPGELQERRRAHDQVAGERPARVRIVGFL